jgi:CHASE3 domain sensor protein
LTLADHIRRRLLVGLLITSITAAASLVVGSLAYLETDQAYSQVLAQTAVIQDLVTKLNDAIVSEVLHTRGYLITGDEQSITNRDLSHQDFQRAYAELQGRLVHLPEATTFTLQELMALHTGYDTLAEEMITLRRSGQTEAAIKLFNERSDPLVLRLLAARQDLQSGVQAWELQADRDYSIRTRQIILVVACVFLVGALASGWLVTRRLASPLAALNYFERALSWRRRRARPDGRCGCRSRRPSVRARSFRPTIR